MMILIAYVFSKLQTAKDLVRPMFKKRRFRTLSESQHVKGSQTLVKSADSTFIIFFITLKKTDLENISLSNI